MRREAGSRPTRHRPPPALNEGLGAAETMGGLASRALATRGPAPGRGGACPITRFEKPEPGSIPHMWVLAEGCVVVPLTPEH